MPFVSQDNTILPILLVIQLFCKPNKETLIVKGHCIVQILNINSTNIILALLNILLYNKKSNKITLKYNKINVLYYYKLVKQSVTNLKNFLLQAMPAYYV